MNNKEQHNVRAIHGGSLPAEQILEGAKEKDFDWCMVIGRKDGDNNQYIYVTGGTNAEVLWEIEHAKNTILYD